MNKGSLSLAVLVLTLMAFAPAVSRADDEMDDLEVTLEVFDDVQDLDDAIAEMEGPGDNDVRDVDWVSSGDVEDEPEEGEPDDSAEGGDDSADDFEDEMEDEFEDELEDEFEHDEEADSEDDLDDEDDFEDEDDVDEDEFDDEEDDEAPV